MKRAISFLLTILMLVSIVPIQALAVEESEENVTLDPRELTIDGVGSVGMLLSNALTEEQQEKSEELEHIADVEITGNVAVVSYQVLDDDCSVVVALYDDEHPETMLASGTAEVTADETKVEVTFDGTMPEHFLAMAYLIDRQTLAPRCSAFVSRLYTQEMQKFLATTVDDYKEDLVLNLDDDKTTNFAVFSEDTQQLEGSGTKNQLTDHGDGTYTITHADESVTALKAGDVFSYPLTEKNEMLLVKIKAISASGSTVTITEDEDVALEDFFDYFKVETNGADGGEMTVDTDAAAEGVAYVEPGQGDMPLLGALVDEDASLKFSAGFKLDKTLAGGDGAKVKLTGSLGLDFGVSLKCYITMQYQYISLKLDTKLNFSAGFSGKLTLVEIPLGRIEIPVLPCINVGFTPAFVTEVSAKIECKGSVKTTIGFAYDSDVGFINLSSWPKLEAKVEFSGTLFVGFQAEPYVAVISADLCKASVKCSAGVEIEGKQTIGQPSESSRHDCIGCIAGTVKTKLEVSVGVDIIKGWLKKEAKLAATDKKYGDFYCSLDHLEFGWGTCPHIRYKTTVTVQDKNGDPAPHAIINGTKLATAPVTNAGGQAVFYLPNGTYTLFVTNGGQTTRKTVTIHDSGKALTITYGEADSGGSGWGGGGGGGSGWGEPIMGNIVASGDCGAQGDNVQWKLDSSGLLYIYGEGAMANYNIRSAPWHSYRDTIKKVVIGGGVTSIGYGAFRYCYSLTTVTIPDSVTTIGKSAFEGCYSLTTVTIPDSVTSIGDRAFFDCESLTSFTVDSNNPSYSSDSNGVLFNKNKTELIQYPIGNPKASYVIPGSVTTIGEGAFQWCTGLTSVTIPDSVTTIGDSAFGYCYSLTSVTIPDSVTSIGDDAFYACERLTTATIGDSVTTIGDEAFRACSSLTTVSIGEGVTSIGDWAFEYCRSLTTVTIPDSVTSIGYGAFYDCDSLTAVTIPDSVTSIGHSAFYDCDSLTAVTIPDSVTSIGDEAFFHCYRLTTVTIPDSVTTIGKSAFAGCESLTAVTIPDSVTSIGDEAFYACDSLTSVTIGNSVTSIGDWAFYSCDSLTTVTIPDSVTIIGKSAFAGCESLTAVTIPDSVTSIDYGAFAYCDSLTSVTIGNSVTSIDYGAFYSCDSLSAVTIGNSVTSIGGGAFWGCYYLTDVYYTGTQAQWEAISIGNDNYSLIDAAIHYNATAPVVNAAPVVSAAAERPAAPTELPVPELPVPPMPQRETLFEELSAPTPLGAMLPPAENTVEDRTVTSRFSGLLPGMDYILLVVKDPAAENLLAPENLLYIAQGTATEEGAASFTYCLAADDTAWPYAGGLVQNDCNGDGAVDIVDMACLYTYLSTGENEGQLNAGTFAAIADVNGDGSINILDYQALYEMVKK